jgi:hypothetical protein
MRPLILALAITAVSCATMHAQAPNHDHPSAGLEEGLGRAHMETSCASAVSPEFDQSLALLHNFWYARALEHFNQVARDDPECAMAYWGAAMTYNHPFWDPPSKADEGAAWTLVQKAMAAQKASAREKLYLAAIAELCKDAGAGTREKLLLGVEHIERAQRALSGCDGSSPRGISRR